MKTPDSCRVLSISWLHFSLVSFLGLCQKALAMEEMTSHQTTEYLKGHHCRKLSYPHQPISSSLHINLGKGPSPFYNKLLTGPSLVQLISCCEFEGSSHIMLGSHLYHFSSPRSYILFASSFMMLPESWRDDLVYCPLIQQLNIIVAVIILKTLTSDGSLYSS